MITLVGAGPGDPELITMKGLRAIEQADVILYDALVSPILLEHAGPQCAKVYVGKKKGHKEFEQEEINEMLVSFATQSKRVVRLKGGDSYVFGRGHEEVEYAVRRGIAVEVIPGVTSALAGPTSVGIPVTKRGLNESFFVVTGMLANGEMSEDIITAAHTASTVIILMGMPHLEEIAKAFAKIRSPREPIAVIQNATRPDQNVAVGCAENIASMVKESGIESPAVIVIGAVVEERKRIQELVDQMK